MQLPSRRIQWHVIHVGCDITSNTMAHTSQSSVPTMCPALIQNGYRILVVDHVLFLYSHHIFLHRQSHSVKHYHTASAHTESIPSTTRVHTGSVHACLCWKAKLHKHSRTGHSELKPNWVSKRDRMQRTLESSGIQTPPTPQTSIFWKWPIFFQQVNGRVAFDLLLYQYSHRI